MRIISTVAAILISSLGMSSPASAWWEYAKWGLTEEQLVAASNGAAKPCVAEVAFCAYFKGVVDRGFYVLGLNIVNLSADVLFSFEAGKLSSTAIVFPEGAGNFRRLSKALLGVYGAPVSSETSSLDTHIWRDATKGTVITINDFSTPMVHYSPFARGL